MWYHGDVMGPLVEAMRADAVRLMPPRRRVRRTGTRPAAPSPAARPALAR